ncbi:hypothetical protein HYX58_06055 [Candidatus Dependentiae bacterium]|nr:hypothetical protein [Candidatus Dependentiae bacterium]
MMEFFKRLQITIDSIDEKQFRYYVLAAFGVIFLIAGIIVYRYYSTLGTLRKKTIEINRKREQVSELLGRYEMVKKQQAEVDAILAKDKDFKIGGYFNDLVLKFGLASNKTREPETSRETLDNGYTEVKLYASFTNMTTKQVAELLDAIEQTDRVYTKEVEMYKQTGNGNGQTINVNLLIATIEPKAEEISAVAE